MPLIFADEFAAAVEGEVARAADADGGGCAAAVGERMARRDVETTGGVG